MRDARHDAQPSASGAGDHTRARARSPRATAAGRLPVERLHAAERGLVRGRALRRDREPGGRLVECASVAIGVFSFAYHASYTFALQFFDFVAMFLFCFTVLARNAVRLGWVHAPRETRFFALGVLGMSAGVPPLFYAGFPIQALVGLLIAVGLAQEWRLRRRDGPSPAYRIYLVGLALLGAAAVASLLDVTRIACAPQSLLQGHAVWHVLSALALAAFFRFYTAMGRARAGSLFAP